MKTFYITVIDKEPDKNGKQHFWIQWLSNQLGRKRNETGLFGQHFFGNLNEHISLYKERNINVVFVDKIQEYNPKIHK